jgi:hypothetical protein
MIRANPQIILIPRSHKIQTDTLPGIARVKAPRCARPLNESQFNIANAHDLPDWLVISIDTPFRNAPALHHCLPRRRNFPVILGGKFAVSGVRAMSGSEQPNHFAFANNILNFYMVASMATFFKVLRISLD